MFKKMRKIKNSTWDMLTTGEKVLKFIMRLVKLAVIIAAIVAVIAVLMTLIGSFIIAMGITSAIVGGLKAAGSAYSPGDRYVRFW